MIGHVTGKRTSTEVMGQSVYIYWVPQAIPPLPLVSCQRQSSGVTANKMRAHTVPIR